MFRLDSNAEGPEDLSALAKPDNVKTDIKPKANSLILESALKIPDNNDLIFNSVLTESSNFDISNFKNPNKPTFYKDSKTSPISNDSKISPISAFNKEETDAIANIAKTRNKNIDKYLTNYEGGNKVSADEMWTYIHEGGAYLARDSQGVLLKDDKGSYIPFYKPKNFKARQLASDTQKYNHVNKLKERWKKEHNGVDPTDEQLDNYILGAYDPRLVQTLDMAIPMIKNNFPDMVESVEINSKVNANRGVRHKGDESKAAKKSRHYYGDALDFGFEFKPGVNREDAIRKIKCFIGLKVHQGIFPYELRLEGDDASTWIHMDMNHTKSNTKSDRVSIFSDRGKRTQKMFEEMLENSK